MVHKKYRIVMGVYSIATACAIALAGIPAYADYSTGEVTETETVTGSTTEETTSSTSVSASRSEEFSVTIPKTISLDGSENNPTQSFNVTVSGDIIGSSSIRVTSDETFLLKQTGKADVVVNAGYDHTWEGADVTETGTSYSGTLTVPETITVDTETVPNKLSGGYWTGSVTFRIQYVSD